MTAQGGQSSGVQTAAPSNGTPSLEELAAVKARFGYSDCLEGGEDDQDLIEQALKSRDHLLQHFARDRLHSARNETAILDWDKTIRAYCKTWRDNMGIAKEEGEHQSFYCTKVAAQA